MFGQIKIKMKMPWYDSWLTHISRRRDGKPRMIGGQLYTTHTLVGCHAFLPQGWEVYSSTIWLSIE